MIDKNQLFACCGLKKTTVEIEGLGEVGITELSSGQREQVFTLFNDSETPLAARTLTAVLGCDLLEEGDLERVTSEFSPESVTSIYEAVMDLSGLGDSEDAEKN